MRCSDCGYNCHEKCLPHVPKNCARLRPVSEISDSNTTLSKASIAETQSVTGGLYMHIGNLLIECNQFLFHNLNTLYIDKIKIFNI